MEDARTELTKVFYSPNLDEESLKKLFNEDLSNKFLSKL